MTCRCTTCQLDTITELLTHQGATLMALQDDLNQVTQQLGKSKDEILSKVSDLEERIASLEGVVADNAEARTELEAAKATVADLRTAAQSLDDVVPDTPDQPA